MEENIFITHFKLADIYYDMGQFEQALVNYKKCLLLHPFKYQTNLNVGGCFSKL